MFAEPAPLAAVARFAPELSPLLCLAVRVRELGKAARAEVVVGAGFVEPVRATKQT